jgi:hypothetical protein
MVRLAQGDGVGLTADTGSDFSRQGDRRRAQHDALGIGAGIIAKADFHVPVRAHRLGRHGERLLEEFLRGRVLGHLSLIWCAGAQSRSPRRRRPG